METMNYSPRPPEQGIVAESAYFIQEKISNLSRKNHERGAVNAAEKLEKLERYQHVAGEVLDHTGIKPPVAEPAIDEPSRPPTFIQRRREMKWARHAVKRKLNGYDSSLHSPYGGTWQGDLMNITAGVSKFFTKREVGKTYKSGAISASKALQQKTTIGSHSRRDFVPGAVHDAISRTSRAFSGDSLLLARTHGFYRSGRIERLYRRVESHINDADKARRKSEDLARKRSDARTSRKNWQEVKRTQGIV